MSLDAERNENMGRPKGSVSIYDDGPRSARCETCGFCAVSEAVIGVRRGPQAVHVHSLPRLRARHAGAREVQLLGGAP